MFDFEVTINDLVWQSDWNGYEVGYPDSEIVGLYMKEVGFSQNYFYIDMVTMELLEAWVVTEDDE